MKCFVQFCFPSGHEVYSDFMEYLTDLQLRLQNVSLNWNSQAFFIVLDGSRWGLAEQYCVYTVSSPCHQVADCMFIYMCSLKWTLLAEKSEVFLLVSFQTRERFNATKEQAQSLMNKVQQVNETQQQPPEPGFWNTNIGKHEPFNPFTPKLKKWGSENWWCNHLSSE